MSKKTVAKKPAQKTTRRPGIRTAKPAAKAPRAAVKGTPAPAPAVEKRAPATAKPERQTRAGLAYRLIQEGKSNIEVWEALRAAFDMPEHHSYYPTWYRAKLVQLGTITKAFAAAHRGPAIPRKPAGSK